MTTDGSRRLVSLLRPADEVVGEAADAATVLQQAAQLNPDVVLRYIRLEGHSGISVGRHLLQQVPASRVIMLTSFEDEDYMFKALQAGASGYLAKTATQEEIGAAITAVARGERFLSTAMANRLVARFSQVAEQMELIRKQAAE
jgi:DNA-binding NarL/FixJ family response regulator